MVKGPVVLKPKRLWRSVSHWAPHWRWLVAVLIVPVLPLACVSAVGSVSWLFEVWAVFFFSLVLGYALLPCVPIVWLSIFPVYLLIGKWGQHSIESYRRGAMLAAVIAAVLMAAYAEISTPSWQLNEALWAIAFGLVIAVPYAALVGGMIWRVLRTGREPTTVKS